MPNASATIRDFIMPPPSADRRLSGWLCAHFLTRLMQAFDNPVTAA
jgi:hypothetical protein